MKLLILHKLNPTHGGTLLPHVVAKHLIFMMILTVHLESADDYKVKVTQNHAAGAQHLSCELLYGPNWAMTSASCFALRPVCISQSHCNRRTLPCSASTLHLPTAQRPARVLPCSAVFLFPKPPLQLSKANNNFSLP